MSLNRTRQFSFTPTSTEHVDFQYVISSSNRDVSAPVIMAVTATEQTANIFVRTVSDARYGNSWSTWAFANCKNQYENEQSINGIPNYSFIYQDDALHPNLHQSPDDPRMHMHFRFNSTLKISFMRNFLKSVTKCGEKQAKDGEIPPDAKQLTHKIRKDIISKFTQYRSDKAANRLKGTFFASNNPFLERHAKEISLKAHEQCLEHDSRGCLPGNPHTPQGLSELYPAPSPTLPKP